MKIAIVGPGALGTLFAALLSQVRGNEIWLLDHDRRRSRFIGRNGLIVTGLSRFRVPAGKVRATCSPSRIGSCDLVVVMVKCFDTEEAVRSARPCVGADAPVLSLQNGAGNLDSIGRAMKGRRFGGVLGGTTAQGATLLGWGRVRHAGRKPTLIGADAGRAGQAGRIAAVFRRACIPSRAVPGTQRLIWSKLVVNSAMNPLGAALQVRNGELVRNGAARLLVRSAARESASVAKAAGIRLLFSDPADEVERICRATASNFNSMLQDYLRGRPTEIEWINGAIVRQARKHGIPAPINAAFLGAFRRAG